MAYKLPNPERERTERNRELKRLRRPDEEDRVARAAVLMLAFHEERDINHVMELAQLIMDHSDDGVAVLVDTYLDGVEGVEDRMERLAMLANVARWIDDDRLGDVSRSRGADVAVEWCAAVTDEIDRAERFGLVERRFDAGVREAVQQRLA